MTRAATGHLTGHSAKFWAVADEQMDTLPAFELLTLSRDSAHLLWCNEACDLNREPKGWVSQGMVFWLDCFFYVLGGERKFHYLKCKMQWFLVYSLNYATVTTV